VNAQRVIILFVKYPQPGRVKTRLALKLGDEAAVSIYRQLVDRLIHMLRGVKVEEIRVCFDPAEKHYEVEHWLKPIWLEAGMGLIADNDSDDEASLVFRPQCEGDLGERLKSAFSEVFQENEKAGICESRVIAIGSDCIELDEQTFQVAWEFLETKEVVFGPTPDGGYYLVGMKEPRLDLFENIPWSTDQTLEASLQRARKSGLEIAELDEKHDIDTEEDWSRAKAKFSLTDPDETDEATMGIE